MTTKTALPRGFWLTAAKLALPIALQNLLISCAALIDTVMIVPLGNDAVVGVGVAGRFAFFLNVMAFGFCSGSATLISQFWGVKDKGGIRHSYGVALTFAMLLSFIYAAVLFFFPGLCISLFGPETLPAQKATEYLKIYALGVPFLMYSQVSCAALRATEKVSVPLVSSLAAVLTNTSLNFCLIHGNLGFPALGVQGAAIATAAGTVAQALIVFIALQFGKNAIRDRFSQYFNYTKDFVFKFAKTAAPVLFNEVLWAVGTNVYVMVLTRQSTEDYSGYTIYETVQQLFFVFFVGICHAAAILVGKAVGRGRFAEAYGIAGRFMVLTPLSGVLLGGLLILLRHPILSLLAIETEGARATAAALLLLYGAWIPLRMISYTAVCGVFRAGGDTKAGCIFDMSCLYGVGIPAVCIAGLLMKLPFVAIVAVMFMGEDIPKTVLCVRHFLSKKWIVKLTDDKAEGGDIL